MLSYISKNLFYPTFKSLLLNMRKKFYNTKFKRKRELQNLKILKFCKDVNNFITIYQKIKLKNIKPKIIFTKKYLDLT